MFFQEKLPIVLSLWGNSPSWNFLRRFFLNEFVWCRVSFANCPATMLKSWWNPMTTHYLNCTCQQWVETARVEWHYYASITRHFLDLYLRWISSGSLNKIYDPFIGNSRLGYHLHTLPFQISSARPQTRINQGPIPFKLTHFPVVPMIINLWRIVGP